MLLENEPVEMHWHPTNRKKYEARGYIFTQNGDAFYPKAKDVMECSSGVKIPVQCDYCGKVYYPTSRNYQKVRDRGELDCCVSCKGKKIKAMVQEIYGVDNIALVPEIAEKTQQTCLERFGVKHPLQSKEIFNKTQETLFEKHGVTSAAHIPESQEKKKQTSRERYGYDYPVQSPEVQIKIHQSYYQNGSAPVSKRQKELANLLEEMYGNCELNYPCDMLSLDCMVVIDGIAYDIEYDGWYWHKDRKDEDRKRAYYVESVGYKVIRFLAYADRIPTEKEIRDTIEYLTTKNKKFALLELR